VALVDCKSQELHCGVWLQKSPRWSFCMASAAMQPQHIDYG